jgi:hypothetical protein
MVLLEDSSLNGLFDNRVPTRKIVAKKPLLEIGTPFASELFNSQFQKTEVHFLCRRTRNQCNIL